MTEILKICVSPDGFTLIAYDPFGEREITSDPIRSDQKPEGAAMSDALRLLGQRLADCREWIEGGM